MHCLTQIRTPKETGWFQLDISAKIRAVYVKPKVRRSFPSDLLSATYNNMQSSYRNIAFFLLQLLALLIQSIAAFPVMFIAVVALVDWDTKSEELYVWVVTVLYFLFFLGIAVMPTGSYPAPCYDGFVR